MCHSPWFDFLFEFWFFCCPQGGGGSVQVNWAKKTPDFTEYSENMDKIMPNGEKKSQKSKQTTKSVKWYTPFKNNFFYHTAKVLMYGKSSKEFISKTIEIKILEFCILKLSRTLLFKVPYHVINFYFILLL